MDDVAIAVVLAASLSIVICVIELRYLSKATLWDCTNGSAFFYLVILIVGNTATTLFAAATTAQFLAGSSTAPGSSPQNATTATEDKTQLKGATQPAPPRDTPKTNSSDQQHPKAFVFSFPWFWYAFLGVFAFEALLQNINITFVDRGVLSLRDWISKARDNAVAVAIEAHANADVKQAQQLATRLSTLSDDLLDTHVLNILGEARLIALRASISTHRVNSRLTKAFALAYESPKRANAILT
jgi:hypothetical protein